MYHFVASSHLLVVSQCDVRLHLEATARGARTKAAWPKPASADTARRAARYASARRAIVCCLVHNLSLVEQHVLPRVRRVSTIRPLRVCVRKWGQDLLTVPYRSPATILLAPGSGRPGSSRPREPVYVFSTSTHYVCTPVPQQYSCSEALRTTTKTKHNSLTHFVAITFP